MASDSFSDSEVKKIILSWYMICSVCFIWSLGVVGGLSICIYSFAIDDGLSGFSIAGICFGLFHALLLYGVLSMSPWGRVLGLICAVLYIPFIPLGTIVGITGVMGFSGAKAVFIGHKSLLKDLKQLYLQQRA